MGKLLFSMWIVYTILTFLSVEKNKDIFNFSMRIMITLIIPAFLTFVFFIVALPFYLILIYIF